MMHKTDRAPVEDLPQQLIPTKMRQDSLGREAWDELRMSEELLSSTDKSKMLQFIDQAARQLASSDHTCPPVHVVLGLYNYPGPTYERTRYTMEDAIQRDPFRQHGLIHILSDWRPFVESRHPFELTIQYLGYLEQDEPTIPKALPEADVGGTETSAGEQMSEAEWQQWQP